MKQNFLYYFIGSIIASGLGFWVAIYLSHTITPEDYGILGIFAMLLYIFEPLVGFFAFGLLEINLVTMDSSRYILFKNKFINFGLLNFLFLSIIFFVTSVFLNSYRVLLYFLPLMALTRFFLKIQWLEMIQQQRAKEYAFYFSLYSIGMLVLTVVFISMLNLSWQGRISAMFIAELVLVYIFFKSYKFNWKLFTKQELKELIAFGMPLFIALGAAWIIQESDKLIILKYFDLNIVGIYTFSYLIGRIMQIFNQTLIRILRPYYYKKLKDKTLSIKEHTAITLMYLFGGITIATLSSYLLLEYGSFFIDSNYLSGIKVIIIIFFSFIFFGAYQISSLILEFLKKNKEKMFFLYGAAFVNLFFSILLIEKFSFLSPAIGTLIGFVFILFLGYLISIYYLKENL